MARLKYRLALDLGANSLGWCVYRLDGNDEPMDFARLGSRIFSDGRDPKSLASLAADRRLARQARRRRDRVLKRRHRLLQGLVRYGLMPESDIERKALQITDPYVLRAKGLDQPLTPHEFGRALYHLARKRGFRSSRKESRGVEDEKETGKVKEAIQRLRAQVAEAGCRTVGEHLARQHAERKPVRARRSSDGQYVLYLQRDMVSEEFDALWMAQQRFHARILTDEARDYLKDALLFQRKLLPVKPGNCLFENEEFRAKLCSPLQQRFRILQELNNLRLIEGLAQRPLTLSERNHLLHKLLRTSQMTFAQMRKELGFSRSAGVRFNLESEKRKGLKGDLVSSQFSTPSRLGEAWFEWPLEKREEFAELVERVDEKAELVAILTKPPWSLDASKAAAVSECRLPDDFGSLSHKALAKIVPQLEQEVITYDIAVRRAGYQHHSQLHTGEFFQQLPYYGELLRGYTSPTEKAKDSAERQFGKIPNPTVHIGLNQLRRLVNALVRRYGHPHQIIIELTREFGLSGERRREIEKEQADNQKRNERYDAELERLGLPPNRENRLKLRLWEELGRDDALDRYCIYSGKRLSKADLFSDEVEIDHILPFSKSLHDGVGNKVLCIRQANRDKGDRTPYAAFGHSPGRYQWDEIMERAERLFAASDSPSLRRKAELFRDGALEVFLQDRDFLDRHLTDTAYLGRAAKQYLSYICHKDNVWVSSGKLTGMLRGKWGLSSLLSGDGTKNRNDHRHHALDAAVIGVCSRSMIQRMATAAARAERHGENRLLESLEFPWPSFREGLRDRLQRMVVSHKPDHGREAALHNDTNYGWRGAPDRHGNPLVGRHVPVDSLKGVADVEGIADPVLKSKLRDLLAPLTSTKDIKTALADFSARTGIRRILKEERLSVIPIHDRRDGTPYRFVKGDGNYCYEIFRREDGRWDGDVVSLYHANRKEYSDSPGSSQSGKPLVMRLHKGDLIAVEEGGHRRIMRIAKFSEGMIALVDHHEANVDSRTRDKSSGFKYMFKSPSALKPLRTRMVGVDVLGYVNDPGFKT